MATEGQADAPSAPQGARLSRPARPCGQSPRAGPPRSTGAAERRPELESWLGPPVWGYNYTRWPRGVQGGERRGGDACSPARAGPSSASPRHVRPLSRHGDHLMRTAGADPGLLTVAQALF